jgi:hypothetical protein
MPDLHRRASIVIATCLTAALACGPADAGGGGNDETAADAIAEQGPFVAEYIARDYAFIGPVELPSGWVTLRLNNEGKEPHFVYLTLLPDGITIEDYANDLGAVFDEAWGERLAGAVDREGMLAILGERVPEWYASARVMGGPGLLAPGRTDDATLRLTPGNYVMECYVKNPEGRFHVSLGMAIPITVTEEDSGASPPDADMTITIRNGGYEIEGSPVAGEQTVAVHFAEQPEAATGNDVHVVRLDGDTDLETVVEWMDWMNLEGLQTPAPGTFLGGVQDMPAGSTAYFTMDLEPGRYAFVGEPGAGRGLVHEFVIE